MDKTTAITRIIERLNFKTWADFLYAIIVTLMIALFWYINFYLFNRDFIDKTDSFTFWIFVLGLSLSYFLFVVCMFAGMTSINFDQKDKLPKLFLLNSIITVLCFAFVTFAYYETGDFENNRFTRIIAFQFAFPAVLLVLIAVLDKILGKRF